MYEEMEQRVVAFQSLLQSHDMEVQCLGDKLKISESEKTEMLAQIKDGEDKSTALQASLKETEQSL